MLLFVFACQCYSSQFQHSGKPSKVLGKDNVSVASTVVSCATSWESPWMGGVFYGVMEMEQPCGDAQRLVCLNCWRSYRSWRNHIGIRRPITVQCKQITVDQQPRKDIWNSGIEGTIHHHRQTTLPFGSPSSLPQNWAGCQFATSLRTKDCFCVCWRNSFVQQTVLLPIALALPARGCVIFTFRMRTASIPWQLSKQRNQVRNSIQHCWIHFGEGNTTPLHNHTSSSDGPHSIYHSIS